MHIHNTDLPKDGFEPITNEIFSQVHYQLCYFGFGFRFNTLGEGPRIIMEIARIELASQ